LPLGHPWILAQITGAAKVGFSAEANHANRVQRPR